MSDTSWTWMEPMPMTDAEIRSNALTNAVKFVESEEVTTTARVIAIAALFEKYIREGKK